MSPAPPSGAVQSPSRTDPVVAAASGVVGGPAGDHLAPRRGPWLAAAPLLALASAVPVLLALWTRSHCRAAGWTSPDQFVHACYSDVPAVVASAATPGQAPTTALVLRALALVSGGQARGAFDAGALLAVLALAAAAVLLVRTRPERPWDAALVALSPAVVTGGLVSVDLVGVALLAGALAALAGRRPLVAGACLALAAGVRPEAALVLVAVWLVVLVRAPRRPVEAADAPDADEAVVARVDAGPAGPSGPSGPAGPAGPAGPPEPAGRWALEVPAALACTLAAVVVGALLDVAARPGWAGQPGGSTWLSVPSGAGYGALWLLPGLPGTLPGGRTPPWGALGAGAVTAVWALGLLAALLAGVVAARSTARRAADGRAHLPSVALVVVAVALLAAPALPVQAPLVVLPLAALAVPRWRELLVWGLVEAAAGTGTWLYLYGQAAEDHRGLPPGGYAALLVLRAAALLWLAVQGARCAGAPGRGPVDEREGPSARAGSL